MDPREYIRKMDTVKGWLTKTCALTIANLNDVQREMSVCGTVGEIGVHHGKLFILLGLMDKSFAIDIFDQSLNVDHSGHGDREIFERNLERFGVTGVHIIQASSTTVGPSDIPGPVRLFSVDGGHTADLTENDLRLAEKCLVDGGIIILDDYFNSFWPDVSVGANRCMDSLIPFAISPNKVYFTNNLECAENYRKALRAEKESEMNGHPVKIVAPPTVKSRIKRLIRG